MNNIRNEYQPDYCPAPGETLAETIAFLGLTQAEVAERLGIAEPTLNKIIHGKAPISPENALALERVVGINATFWNRAEASYRSFLAQRREQQKLHEQQDWIALFPVSAMAAKQLIRRYADVGAQAAELLRYLRIGSPDEWDAQATLMQGYCRHAKARENDPNALGAWLQHGENVARSMQCAPFDAAAFEQVLQTLRAATREPAGTFLPLITEQCRACGVAVVFTPSLPKAKICGFTRWISPTKALIQLSDRYKRCDIFWFSFYHEAAHILKHGKRETFAEFGGKPGDDPKEAEADRFAADTLIPPALYHRVFEDKPHSGEKLMRHAEDIGVAPGIIVGRMRHDKYVAQSQWAEFLTTLDIPDASLPVPTA